MSSDRFGAGADTQATQSKSGTYRVTLDNPAANSRTHVQVDATDRRDARRRAKRAYPRHVVQKVTSVQPETDHSDDDLRTDGGRHRTKTPEWELDGGEGLPLAHDYERSVRNDSQLWLFSCCGCGKRLIDPPGPPAGSCSCGGSWVCHQFDPKAYLAIRRFGDPRRADEL